MGLDDGQVGWPLSNECPVECGRRALNVRELVIRQNRWQTVKALELARRVLLVAVGPKPTRRVKASRVVLPAYLFELSSRASANRP